MSQLTTVIRYNIVVNVRQAGLSQRERNQQLACPFLGTCSRKDTDGNEEGEKEEEENLEEGRRVLVDWVSPCCCRLC